MPRILVVDDHPAIRRGLTLVLEAEGLGSCREAGGFREALDLARSETPDVALVGMSMNNEDNFILLGELCASGIPVIVCSPREDPASVRRVMAAGARGYITKYEAPQAVARAVRAVLDGWMLISPLAAERLTED